MPRFQALLCPIDPCKTSPGALRHAVAARTPVSISGGYDAAPAQKFHRHHPDHHSGARLRPACNDDRHTDACDFPMVGPPPLLPALGPPMRSEELRAGKECVDTFKIRW